MPVLGIIASQMSGHLFAPSGAYDSIATVTGTGSSGTITFSSIPSTYTHLQVRGIMRSTAGGSQVYTRLNGDGGSNYAYHYMYGEGTGATAGGAASQTVGYFGNVPASTDLANTYTSFVIDLLDYSNTNKYKTFRNLSGYDFNGSGQIWFASSVWMNTASVTSLSIVSNTSFNTSTTISLYGIKGGN
jgi:hypothetical protein